VRLWDACTWNSDGVWRPNADRAVVLSAYHRRVLTELLESETDAMKRTASARLLWIVSLLGILLSVTGCAERTTPPRATMISGPLLVPEGTGGSYTLLRWNEGLTITLVDDSQAARHSSGTGSTNDPV
jgi:hypothetical protein